MARPRTPTNVLLLRGAGKKHPERMRDRLEEPQPKAGIGPAPSFFKVRQRECWDYLVGIAPPGVLGDSDRAYLEIAAELLAHKRTVGVGRIDPAKLNRLETMLGKLGMNPSDRSKVRAPSGGQKPRNAFSNLDS